MKILLDTNVNINRIPVIKFRKSSPPCGINVINPRSAISRKDQYAHTHVGKGATIGANSTIVCGHNIGEYAFIGAGAVVTKDIPDYALYVGNPAYQLGWISRCGHRLEFDSEGNAQCPESGERYCLHNGKVSIL